MLRHCEPLRVRNGERRAAGTAVDSPGGLSYHSNDPTQSYRWRNHAHATPL